MNYRDLLKPGAGAQMALEKELEFKAGRPGNGSVYPNPYALLREHGTFFTGRQLPGEYECLCGEMMQCHWTAVEAAQQAPELRFFTGLYMIQGTATWHSWCADTDTKLIELTYPTFPQAGMIDFHTRQPWTPPETWRYIGVEYDTAWVDDYFDHHGTAILDPAYGEDTGLPLPSLGHRYSPRGFPL